MKSILQSTSLSDEALKAAINADETNFPQLLMKTLDLGSLKLAEKQIADRIEERIIGEEFQLFLESIGKGGADASRNGYYRRTIRTCVGDMRIEIPRARYENFRTGILAKYGHDLTDVTSKIIGLCCDGMSESEVCDAIAKTDGIGLSREKVGLIVRQTVGRALEFN